MNSHLYHAQLETIRIALDVRLLVISQVSGLLEGVHEVENSLVGTAVHLHEDLMQHGNAVAEPILIGLPLAIFAYIVRQNIRYEKRLADA